MQRSSSQTSESESLLLYLKVLVEEPPTLQRLTAVPTLTVAALLGRVECSEPAGNLALVLDGVQLPSDAPLGSCGLSQNATLHVIAMRRTLRLRLPGADAVQHPPAALARRLRLDAVRSRHEAQMSLQRARTVETVVPLSLIHI